MKQIFVLYLLKKEETFLKFFPGHWKLAGKLFTPVGMQQAKLYRTSVPHVVVNVADWDSLEAFEKAMKGPNGGRITEEMKGLPHAGFVVLRPEETFPMDTLREEIDLTQHLEPAAAS